MIRQTTNTDPKPIITRNGEKYIFIKKCNDSLYLYENEKYKYKETFTNFELGMVQEPDEKPHYKAHRINF
jgi:hypothetical protein